MKESTLHRTCDLHSASNKYSTIHFGVLSCCYSPAKCSHPGQWSSEIKSRCQQWDERQMQLLINCEHTGPTYVAGQVLVKAWGMTTKGHDPPWQVLALEDCCTLRHCSTKAKSRLSGSRREWWHRYLCLSNSMYLSTLNVCHYNP